MSFAAMLPRALIAWLGSDRSYQQREPAALVLTAAAGAGRGQLGVRQALLPASTLPGIPGPSNQDVPRRSRATSGHRRYASAARVRRFKSLTSREGLELLQAMACYVRTGHHSATTGEWRDGKGLVATSWLHTISRDGDPQLHVHLAVLNAVQRADSADDQWRAADGQHFHQLRHLYGVTVDRAFEQRLLEMGGPGRTSGGRGRPWRGNCRRGCRVRAGRVARDWFGPRESGATLQESTLRVFSRL